MSQTTTSKRPLWDMRWVREPQQDRSARTRAGILEPGNHLACQRRFTLHQDRRTLIDKHLADGGEIEYMRAEADRHSLRRGLEHIVPAGWHQAAADKCDIRRARHDR